MSAAPVGFIGAVGEPLDDERLRGFGGAFAFGDPEHFVTADHVVAAALAAGVRELHVFGPGLEPVPVAEMFRHPVEDVAVLHAPHGTDLRPFSALGEPAEGDAVDFVAVLDRRLSSTVTTLRHVELEPYAFDALVLADDPGGGFSGCPVLAEDGRVVGMSTHSVTLGGARRGLALAVGRSEPWLTATINRERAAA